MKKIRGFTLIEMVLMIAIGSVLIGGIVLFTFQLSRNTMDIKDMMIATYLAKRQVVHIQRWAYDDINNVSPGPDEAPFTGYWYQRKVSEIASVAAPFGTFGLKKIEVLIARAPGDFDQNILVRIITYRQRYVEFGDGLV